MASDSLGDLPHTDSCPDRLIRCRGCKTVMPQWYMMSHVCLHGGLLTVDNIDEVSACGGNCWCQKEATILSGWSGYTSESGSADDFDDGGPPGADTPPGAPGKFLKCVVCEWLKLQIDQWPRHTHELRQMVKDTLSRHLVKMDEKACVVPTEWSQPPKTSKGDGAKGKVKGSMASRSRVMAFQPLRTSLTNAGCPLC